MANSEEDIEKFLDLCYEGDLDKVAQLLIQDPTLITCKDEEKGEVNKKIKYQNKPKRSFTLYILQRFNRNDKK